MEWRRRLLNETQLETRGGCVRRGPMRIHRPFQI